MSVWFTGEVGACEKSYSRCQCGLQVKLERVRSRILELVRPTLDYLLWVCYKDGNIPSSLESISHDRLVHWCHGCPGLVHLLALSYKVREEILSMWTSSGK